MTLPSQEDAEAQPARRGRILFCKTHLASTIREYLARKGDLPIRIVSTSILVQTQLQERLPNKCASNVIHGGRQLLALKFLLDPRKGIPDRIWGRDVSGYADCLSTGLIDFGDDGFVVFGFASEEGDGVRFCEFEGDGAT